MASRKKTEGSTSGPKSEKPKKTAAKKPAAKTVSAPAKKPAATKSRSESALEELQNVGGDFVPTVIVEADAEGITTPAVEPAAIREHTIDQIEPVANDTRPESMLTDWDLHLFNEGTHHKLWEKLGSHLVNGGVMFGVWAPNAASVSVVGDFNGWNTEANPLHARGDSGIWEGFIPGLERGTTYKYHIVARHSGYRVNKADPMAVHQETPPATASKVWDLTYEWNDSEWMKSRHARNSYTAPMSIYEVHLGSWRRVPGDDGELRWMSYREIAQPLAEYVKKMNFTHIELMPVM